jgi:hypothetical protein
VNAGTKSQARGGSAGLHHVYSRALARRWTGPRYFAGYFTGYFTVTEIVCQPVAPFGAGGA